MHFKYVAPDDQETHCHEYPSKSYSFKFLSWFRCFCPLNCFNISVSYSSSEIHNTYPVQKYPSKGSEVYLSTALITIVCLSTFTRDFPSNLNTLYVEILVDIYIIFIIFFTRFLLYNSLIKVVKFKILFIYSYDSSLLSIFLSNRRNSVVIPMFTYLKNHWQYHILSRANLYRLSLEIFFWQSSYQSNRPYLDSSKKKFNFILISTKYHPIENGCSFKY